MPTYQLAHGVHTCIHFDGDAESRRGMPSCLIRLPSARTPAPRS